MVKRFTLLFLLMFVVCTSVQVFAVPVAYRSWTYLDLTALLSPQWSWTLLTSHSYEYERKNDPGKEEKKTFFYEVFTGPTYTMKFDNLTVKLPLWYYYQGFPTRAAVSPTKEDEYYYSHNIEFLPIVEYKIGNLKLWNRIIFHNKVYSTYPTYTTNSLKRGYSLLIREYFRVEYSITDKFAVMIGDEIFQGIIDDEDTKDITPPQPKPRAPLSPGFEYGGFSQNRVYVGFSYKFTPTIILTPMYMYQTQYFKTGNKLTEKDHYLFTTLTFLFKMYE